MRTFVVSDYENEDAKYTIIVMHDQVVCIQWVVSLLMSVLPERCYFFDSYYRYGSKATAPEKLSFMSKKNMRGSRISSTRGAIASLKIPSEIQQSVKEFLYPCRVRAADEGSDPPLLPLCLK